MSGESEKKDDYFKFNDLEILERYSDLANLLEKTITGLSEKQLDLKSDLNSWSIRQIAHHVVDSDILVQNIILAALGNSGCHYDQSWYPVDNSWVETPNYHIRPADLALKLFKTSHESLLSLIKGIPDALDRNVNVRIEVSPDWRKVTIRELLLSRLAHTDHHLRQIRSINHKNNIG